MVFPVVMYGCESWTVKKAECRRIDAFELWCWRRLLRVPWTARRSNQSILKEISHGMSCSELLAHRSRVTCNACRWSGYKNEKQKQTYIFICVITQMESKRTKIDDCKREFSENGKANDLLAFCCVLLPNRVSQTPYN